MPKVNVYNPDGKIVSKTILPKEIFEIPMGFDLVHQVAVSQRANRRVRIAHTKTRAEVSGGGRKPWRQKGTGRARHGSSRSPIWRGGGVAFGPTKQKVYKKRIPKKMRRKALFMVLSAKTKEKLLFVLDKLEIKEPKTKLIAKTIEDLRAKIKGFEKGSILIALPQRDENLILATRNIPKTNTMLAKDLNVLDLLSFKYLIMPKEAVNTIKETFLK